MTKGRVKASTVALAAMSIAGIVFWLQVSHARRGMASYSSGGIGSVSAEVPGLFPMAPLLQTGILAFPPGSEVPRQAVAAAPTAIDALLAGRKLVRTGELTMEVDSYEKAADQASAVVRSVGGYVSEAKSFAAAGEKRRGDLTVRMPSDRFDEAFRRLSALGKRRSEAIRVQDVTKAYVDLETRLRVKRDAEARMREVLRVRTAKLSEIVEAERPLCQHE